MIRKRITPGIILLFSLIQVQHAQQISPETYTVSDTVTDFGLFAKDDILDISLRFDITTYMRKKPKDEYLDAILTYHISKTDSLNREIKLRSRGEFRNGYCDFPPIALNFKKSGDKDGDTIRLNKLKMVTHCETGNEEYLFREYLVYKLFSVLTDSSYRVRLARVNYINTFKKSKPIRTWAFFIEPTEFLANRIGSMQVELATLNQKDILPRSVDRMAVFNYMIGNFDWSVPGQHNCKVFTNPDRRRPELGIVIPYDFDYTGFVNASYVVPPEGLGIVDPRQRIYLGACRDDKSHLESLKEFRAKKDSFYRVINEFTLLSERSRKDLVNFMDDFFSELEKKNDAILKSIQATCKKL